MKATKRKSDKERKRECLGACVFISVSLYIYIYVRDFLNARNFQN